MAAMTSQLAASNDVHREADHMVATLINELGRQQSWASRKKIVDAISTIRLEASLMEAERQYISGGGGDARGLTQTLPKPVNPFLINANPGLVYDPETGRWKPEGARVTVTAADFNVTGD